MSHNAGLWKEARDSMYLWGYYQCEHCCDLRGGCRVDFRKRRKSDNTLLFILIILIV